MENLEEVVAGVQGDMGSLKEQLRSINGNFKQFLKVQEENICTHSPSVTRKAKEELNSAAGDPEGSVPISFAR